MRILIAFITLTLITSCGQNRTDPLADFDIKPFTLEVTDADYSMAYGFKYVVTEHYIMIVFQGQLVGEKNTVIFASALQPSETIESLSKLKLDSLAGRYDNPCVLDGSQVSVHIEKDGKSKFIHLSNYYHPEIGPAIELINELVPEQFRIWYDREELVKALADCE